MDVHGVERPGLVPEFDVSSLEDSVEFHALLGFTPAYTRPEEGFAYLTRDDTHLMLQKAEGPGRRFRTADLDRPYGRGLNFQLEVENVRALYDAIQAADHQPIVDLAHGRRKLFGLRSRGPTAGPPTLASGRCSGIGRSGEH